MNSAFCNTCKALVPTTRFERDGKIYLRKECPTCGPGETLISNDAVRAEQKRALDVEVEHQYEGCDLKCATCGRHDNPKFAFLSVTNHCNMNCPICFDNVPGLGFDFEPPIEYFDTVFKRLSNLPKPPIVCLFGGEPTMRKDLFDIIKLSQSHGLRTRVFTNGLRLADEEYCKALLRTRVGIHFSYDGARTDTYETLRGNPHAMALKQKALDNISKNEDLLHGKIIMVVVLAKGLNEGDLPDILKLIHDRRNIINSAFLMPLVHTWDKAKWGFNPPRMTTEDVEQLVEAALPGGHKLEFLPLGVVHEFASVLESVGKATNVYAGAHPNCESIYQLFSDGKQWQPMAHFLKGSESEIAREILDLNRRRKVREGRCTSLCRLMTSLHLRNKALATIAYTQMGWLLLRRLRIARLLKGWGPTKLYHAGMIPLERLFGARSHDIRRRHLNTQEELRLVVLPLEDNSVLETERLERCPTAHVYMNPRTGRISFVPLCAWKLHHKVVLRSIADHYAEKTHAKSAAGRV